MRLVVNATAYGAEPGGAGVRARCLFGALRGHEIVFCLAEDTPDSVVPAGAEVRRLPVRAAAPLRRWLHLRLPADGDVVFTDHYPALERPTVITLHDAGGPWWRRAIIRRHLRGAAAIVAVSRTVRAAWDVDAVVVPNGVSAEPPDDIAPGRHLVCCDPGLVHKDVETARATARALGLPLREVGRGVRWLAHDELMRELAGAAAVLCPARREGFGLVPLEAMALGRPVVVSDLAAHREVCGEHAFFAPPGDRAAWRAAADAALSAPPGRLAAARAHARALSWEKAADRLAELIATISR